jgi:hypothetical protein
LEDKLKKQGALLKACFIKFFSSWLLSFYGVDYKGRFVRPWTTFGELSFSRPGKDGSAPASKPGNKDNPNSGGVGQKRAVQVWRYKASGLKTPFE